MKKLVYLTVLGLQLLFINCFSQNLVVNGRFNQFYICPDSLDQIDNIAGWRDGGIDANFGKSEAFHTCNGFTTDVSIPTNNFGNQNQLIGSGYGGFIAYSQYHENARNYLVVELSRTVYPGEMVKFDISYVLSSKSGWKAPFGWKFINKSNGQNITLSPNNLFFGHLITPTQPGSGTNTWYNGGLTISFAMVDTATHIGIGNFMDDATSQIQNNMFGTEPYSYIYIDEVRLDLGMTGIEDPKGSEIGIFPNPGKAGIAPNIPTGYNVEFHDLIGRKMDTGKLSSGIYIYTLSNGKDHITGRYIVN